PRPPRWYARCREVGRPAGGRLRPGAASRPGIGPCAYVSHVADILRISSERPAGARLAGVTEVPGYDQDLLAQAWHYGQVALAGALWSLGSAVRGHAVVV